MTLEPMTEPRIYRKRPIDVAAIQWSGDNYDDVVRFVGIMSNMDGDASTPRFLSPDARYDDGGILYPDGLARLWVEANKSWLPLEVGEWILQDRLGFYPCKADVFASSYDEVTP